MGNYFISAGIELQQGADRTRAETELRRLVAETRHEPGCNFFEIRQNLQDPDKFTLWESWTDKDALAAHFEMPHTKAYLSQNLTQVSYIEELSEIGTIKAGER
jgi:quinol monooxygenase YgiN